MSPKTSEQFEQMRTESRQKILEAALELFAYEGFHSTSMNKVAKKAGVSKGLLYNYFESKEDLLRRIFDYLLEISEEYMMPDESKPAEERLRMITEASFDMIQSDNMHWRFVTTIIVQPDVQETLRDYSVNVVENKMGYFKQLLRDLGHDDPEEAAFAYGAIMDGIGLGYLTLGENYPMEKMKDYVMKTFIKK